MKWTVVLLALAAFTGDTARVKKTTSNDEVIQQERIDTQKTLMKQTNSTADEQPALVSQTVTGNFEANKRARNDNNWPSSGKMALYINADSGNIRLDYSTETHWHFRDFETEMSRHETSYLLSQHDKKIYKLEREYYSNGTEIDVFQWEHATTLSYDCHVAELPDVEGSKYMGCVREQFSKRRGLDQYELKDSFRILRSDTALINFDRYSKSNYGVHVSDEGGITKMDMSKSVGKFVGAFAAPAETWTSGSWKTEYSLGNPEAKYPTVFDASVFKPDKAPAAKDRFRQRINLECQKMDPNGLIPLHMSKSLIECLTR